MGPEIIKCELVSHPPVRFIGRRFDSYPNWSLAWEGNWFEQIEQAGDAARINDESYCVLHGFKSLQHVYYLGEFFTEGTPAPDGFDYVDLPRLSAGLVYIKGRIDEVYALTAPSQREAISKALQDSGIYVPKETASHGWISFERDNCPRFTDADDEGNVILDFALYL
ncbi:MAG: hypothetical protein FWH40_00140 [Coriobacteriia bacterium]|nr:hypothetical protein [Coriobacteriia bacterium]